ncbi:MAG: 50S ribosomal protein P1 [Candidatus Aenigmarchaeota archaeon]|nr:50S ribosomal protein P1 [Candidatus Aenigmarchaeota archaeon]
MEYIYAALLLNAVGKDVNEDNVKKVLEAAGIQVDEAKVKALVSALEGVDINEVIEKASQQAFVAAPAAAAPAEGAEAKAEEKKEEEEEKKTEEEATAGLSALFG